MLAGFSLEEAGRFFGEPSSLPADLQQTLRALSAQSAAVAQAAFTKRFNALVGK